MKLGTYDPAQVKLTVGDVEIKAGELVTLTVKRAPMTAERIRLIDQARAATRQLIFDQPYELLAPDAPLSREEVIARRAHKIKLRLRFVRQLGRSGMTAERIAHMVPTSTIGFIRVALAHRDARPRGRQ